MPVSPSIDKKSQTTLQKEIPWNVLDMITVDIGRPGHLAESLAGLMDDESEWDEWVVPDLVKAFDTQNTYVTTAIQKARSVSPPAALSVTKTDVESWYGAVNQARLALQARYQLDALDSLDGVPEEVAQAYFRDRFYTTLLSLFLEYVMDVS